MSVIGEAISWFSATDQDTNPTELDTFREGAFKYMGGRRGTSSRQVKYLTAKHRSLMRQLDERVKDSDDLDEIQALKEFGFKVEQRLSRDIWKLKQQLAHTRNLDELDL